MALEYTGTQVRTSIGQIYVTLLDADGTAPNRDINGSIQILDQRGDVMWDWNGDLKPHLSAGQLSGLSDFLDSLRTQAETELLP